MKLTALRGIATAAIALAAASLALPLLVFITTLGYPARVSYAWPEVLVTGVALAVVPAALVFISLMLLQAMTSLRTRYLAIAAVTFLAGYVGIFSPLLVILGLTTIPPMVAFASAMLIGVPRQAERTEDELSLAFIASSLVYAGYAVWGILIINGALSEPSEPGLRGGWFLLVTAAALWVLVVGTLTSRRLRMKAAQSAGLERTES